MRKSERCGMTDKQKEAFRELRAWCERFDVKVDSGENLTFWFADEMEKLGCSIIETASFDAETECVGFGPDTEFFL